MNLLSIKKLCYKLLKTSYELDSIDMEINILPTFTFNEQKNIWVEDNCTIFINVNYNARKMLNDKNISIDDLSKSIESIIGFECCTNICL